MINQRGWPQKWRDELDVILAQAAAFKGVHDRRAELLKLLKEAKEQGKKWAPLVYAGFLDEGADRLLTAYDNRTRHIAYVDGTTGRVLNKPRVVGNSKKIETRTEHQRELITIMTWDELRAKRRLFLSQARAAQDTVALIDKLLSLHVMCPQAKTPQDAADLLGLDIDDWLISEA